MSPGACDHLRDLFLTVSTHSFVLDALAMAEWAAETAAARVAAASLSGQW